MKDLLRKFLYLLFSLHITTLILPSIQIKGGLEGLLWSTFLYYVLNVLIRPILKVLLFPIHLITLSLSMWMVDIILFIVWTFIDPHVFITSADVASIQLGFIRIGSVHLVYWQSLLVGGIILRLIIKFLEWLHD